MTDDLPTIKPLMRDKRGRVVPHMDPDAKDVFDVLYMSLPNYRRKVMQKQRKEDEGHGNQKSIDLAQERFKRIDAIRMKRLMGKIRTGVGVPPAPCYQEKPWEKLLGDFLERRNDAEIIDALAFAYLSGLSYGELSEATGICRSQVAKILQRNGVPAENRVHLCGREKRDERTKQVLKIIADTREMMNGKAYNTVKNV